MSIRERYKRLGHLVARAYMVEKEEDRVFIFKDGSRYSIDKWDPFFDLQNFLTCYWIYLRVFDADSDFEKTVHYHLNHPLEGSVKSAMQFIVDMLIHKKIIKRNEVENI